MKTRNVVIRKGLKSIAFFFLQMIAVFWALDWTLFYFLWQCGIDEYNYAEFSQLPKRSLHIPVHIGVGILTGILYSASELFFKKIFPTTPLWSFDFDQNSGLFFYCRNIIDSNS